MLINVCIFDVQNRVLTHLATNWGIFRVKFVRWLVNSPESVVALLCFAQERACFRDSFVSFCHWSRLVLRLSQGGHGGFLSALGLSRGRGAPHCDPIPRPISLPAVSPSLCIWEAHPLSGLVSKLILTFSANIPSSVLGLASFTPSLERFEMALFLPWYSFYPGP